MSDPERVPLREVELCDSPVFIIGSPRSGTTVLAHSLGQHPELWVSKESYFIHQLFGNGRADAVWRDNWQRATPSWLRAEGVERSEFLEALGIGVNTIYSSRSRGRRWVDQTPLYTRMVNDLAAMFPHAQFVHMLRDGRSVVTSMGSFKNVIDEQARDAGPGEFPAWTRDFDLACETWSTWVTTALDFEASHPGRCLTVRNEELSTEPDAGFSRISRFLGVADDPAPAALFAKGRINSSFVGRPARPTPAIDGWSEQRRATFAAVAGATLDRAGYT